MEMRPGQTLTPRLPALRPQAVTTLGSAGAPCCGADMGGQGCSPQGAGPALPGSMCSSPLAAPSTDTAAPQTGPVPSKDAVQRQEEHPRPTFRTHTHTHNTSLGHMDVCTQGAPSHATNVRSSSGR